MSDSLIAKNRYIFPGRFQPFHNDHLQVIRQALVIARPIFIGIILNVVYEPNIATPFEFEARRQNSPERSLFSAVERLEMISQCLREELGRIDNPTYPLLLPRPEANWNVVELMFPGKRTWIVPDSGEEFDQMKAGYFIAMGDDVLRVPVPSSTSGRELRDGIESDTHTWSTHVPRAIAHYVRALRGDTHA